MLGKVSFNKNINSKCPFVDIHFFYRYAKTFKSPIDKTTSEMFLNKYECPLCKSIGNSFVLFYPNLALSNLSSHSTHNINKIGLGANLNESQNSNVSENWVQTMKKYTTDNYKGRICLVFLTNHFNLKIFPNNLANFTDEIIKIIQDFGELSLKYGLNKVKDGLNTSQIPLSVWLNCSYTIESIG
jgi:hypothetical protein